MSRTFETQVRAAIGCHGIWRERLKDAIESGHSDYSVDTVKRDDTCDFGSWLKAAGHEGAGHEGAGHEVVRELHATFHLEAANVLQLAITGRKADAAASMAPGGPFSKASSTLVVSLKGWQEAAEAGRAAPGVLP